MKLDLVFCRACDCAHEPGQHKRRGTAPPSSWDDGSVKAKPERAKPKFDPGSGAKVQPKPTPKNILNTARNKSVKAVGDGVALTTIKHPKGPGPGRGHRIEKASLETVEIEIDKRFAQRPAPRKKARSSFKYNATIVSDPIATALTPGVFKPSTSPKARSTNPRALKVSTTAPTSKRVETRPRGSRNDYQAGLMRIIRAAEKEGITPAQWRAKHGDKPPALVRKRKKK